MEYGIRTPSGFRMIEIQGWTQKADGGGTLNQDNGRVGVDLINSSLTNSVGIAQGTSVASASAPTESTITTPSNLISSTVATTVALGGTAYSSQLTVSSSGKVAPTVFGANAVYSNVSNSSLTNNGSIYGASGYSGAQAGAAGVGVELTTTGSVTNFGLIQGGTGGYGLGVPGISVAHGGLGGIGVNLDTSISVARMYLHNYGTIVGGVGGTGTDFRGVSTYGGTGVYANGLSTVTNAGRITGGVGTGVGVFLNGEAILTNTTAGVITGGAGSVDLAGYGGPGGTGVVDAGTLTNNGQITGGAGGIGLVGVDSTNSRGGDGVDISNGKFTNNSTGTVTAGASSEDAAGIGLYALGGPATIVNLGHILGSSGAVLGFSGGYDQVSAVNLAAGSSLSNSGTITGGNSVGLVGYGAGAGVILQGDGDSLDNAAAGVIAAGAGSMGRAGVIMLGNDTVTNAGQITGGNGSAAGGVGILENAGTVATSGTIAGGENGNGITADAVLFGGPASLSVSAGAVFQGAIGGFQVGDTIDFTDLNPTQVAADLVGDTLSTGTDGTLQFAGIVTGESFVFTNDGGGGTDVTLNAPRTLLWTGAGTGAFSDAGNWDDTTFGNNPASWDENSTDSIVIGESSLAAVTIGAGSSNAAANAVISDSTTAAGSTLIVSGAGATLAVTNALTVGQAGEGTLSLSQGGAVSAGSATLGAGSGSDGVVTVHGAGSEFNVTGALSVGGSGTGELDVLGGASATVGTLSIGGAASTGNVDIEGAGSALNVTGSSLDIGSLTGGGAELTVGAGTTLNFNGSIVEAGQASLNDDGGTIDPASVTYSGDSNSLTGTLLVQQYIDTSGGSQAPGSGISVVNGTAIVTSPLVIFGDSVAHAQSNIAAATGEGKWTIGQGGSLVFNANLVDAGQVIDFSSGDTHSSLVIGQVVDGYQAGGDPNTGVAGTEPSIAAGAENLLEAGGFQATIQDYQVGDSILLNGATATSFEVEGGGVLGLTFADGGTATLTFTNGTGKAPASLATVQAAGEQITGEAACYRRGTWIRTARGEIPIEQLSVGEEVLTANRERKPIRWLGSRHIECERHPNPTLVWPIRIEAGALAPNTPMRDLWVSPGHSLYLEGVLIPAEKLINGASIVQVRQARVQYWHVELDSHDLLLAEGAPAESYLDTGNRSAFSNGGQLTEAYLDFLPKHWSETCVPLILEGEPIARAKRILLERATALGYTLTEEADLHILADGERIEPIELGQTDETGQTRVAFAIPPARHVIELRCRSFVPAHIDPSSPDSRSLGVCVRRLQIDGEDLALDDAQIYGQGWHALEDYGPAPPHRWSMGRTPMPAAAQIIVMDFTQGRHWVRPTGEAVAHMFGRRTPIAALEANAAATSAAKTRV